MIFRGAAIQAADGILRGLRQVSGYFLRSLRPYPQYPAVLHRLIFFLRSAQEQGYDLHPYQQMPVPYLLNMTKKEFETCKAEDYISYARVLGFCKDAAPLLTEIKKNSSIPLITSLADARQTLPADALRMLNQDILRNQIYLGHLALKNKKEW